MPINQRMDGHGLMSQWYATIEIAVAPNQISTILTQTVVCHGRTTTANNSNGAW